MEPEIGCWVWDSPDLLFLVVTDITLGGLEIGVLTMKKGEVARFIFAPNYAYGQQGCLPLIPPDATVLFEVELIDFLDSADSDTFFALTAVSCFNKAWGKNLEDKLCCLSLQLLRIMCYICLFNAGTVIRTLGCWIRADADMCPLKLILHALPCLQPSAG